jgi:hypothetical protein
MFLILLTIFFGIASLRNPKNHYEARWICGIAVLSVPVWVLFGLVASLGPIRMGDAAIAIGLLLNATIMLFLGPMRKLYLLHKFQEKLEEEEHKSQLNGHSQKDFVMKQYQKISLIELETLHKQETEKDLRRKNLMAYNEAI